MAICLTYGTPYVGKYKYGMDMPEKLKLRLSKLTELFPMCRHTAHNGSRYDYTCVDCETKHLSAKSTKTAIGKVAPQVIGQPNPIKFCDIMGIEYTNVPDLKKYIQTEIVKILPVLVDYTFDCPNVYYNHKKDTIRYITMDTPIEWTAYDFKWTRDWNDWKNSSTLSIVVGKKKVNLLEVQFHTKSRKNMVIRWFYDNFLILFKENLSIVDI